MSVSLKYKWSAFFLDCGFGKDRDGMFSVLVSVSLNSFTSACSLFVTFSFILSASLGYRGLYRSIFFCICHCVQRTMGEDLPLTAAVPRSEYNRASLGTGSEALLLESSSVIQLSLRGRQRGTEKRCSPSRKYSLGHHQWIRELAYCPIWPLK